VDAGVFVVRFGRDGGELGLVGDALDRFERGLRVDGMSRDARQQFRVLNLAERRGPHRIVRRRLGDRREVLLIAHPVERRGGVGVGFGRPVGDGDQPFSELAPKRLVSLGPGDPCQISHDPDSLDGGAPDAHVFVGRCQLRDDAPRLGVVWQLRHAGEPDGRVGVAILGLRLEAIEERHGGSLTSIG
jgi:hypothetical protein